ncbi:hypothetical protein GIB67_040995 [Kingdonia uniflora]|uniref:RRM domain-containing protein n=1 Tax=Kingdonia uniflora TaxID=39325 RepID=A0A7J7NCD1_9MAGN|nr:hypothetical protein GIB67_040995 [Kingdonia uniflora]
MEPSNPNSISMNPYTEPNHTSHYPYETLIPQPHPHFAPQSHRLPITPMYHHHHPPHVALDPIQQQHHQPYDPNYFYSHQQQQQQQPEFDYDDKQPKINTLFLSGLPDDIKAREIHNLFRRRIGFDFCQMKYTGRGKQVVAFATFFNHQSAVAAMNVLNGAAFDPETEATLYVELARSNSRPKRLREVGAYQLNIPESSLLGSLTGTEAYFVIDKRTKAKVSTDAQENSSDEGDDGSDEPSGTNNPNSSDKGDLATTESGETTVDPDNTKAVAEKLPEKSEAGGVPPCSTLFIANLGPNCTDEELKQALSQCPGLNMVKMRANRGMPVAFADFKSVENATEAKQSLQGSMLPSSDRGGLHLEYPFLLFFIISELTKRPCLVCGKRRSRK